MTAAHLASEQDDGRRPLPGACGVIACVDGPYYMAGICDHAAWLAGRLSTTIELLHVNETRPARRGDKAARTQVAAQDSVLADAADRLREGGAEVVESCVSDGAFPSVVEGLAADAAAVVIGRRGSATATRARRGVGGDVRPVLQACAAPVLVAPKVFLPIGRAVALLDRARRDRGFADQLATCPLLDGVTVGLARAEGGDGPVRLVPHGAPPPQLAEASARPAAAPPCDLVVIPRVLLLEAPGSPDFAVVDTLLRSRLPLLFL
ncbi:MAG: universal stress protein [Caulobacterales bacterium]